MDESLKEFLASLNLNQKSAPIEPMAYGEVLETLLVSCALGLVVAALYRFSSRDRGGAAGLAGMLITLTMLITMVTMAIKGSTAAAFALFGTLAIVRFRTPVRDVRDTGFVIYAVVVGLAVGAFNYPVALMGAGVIGLVNVAMSMKRPFKLNSSEALDPGAQDVCRLTIRTSSLEYDEEAIRAVISGFSPSHQLVAVRSNRAGDSMRLSWDAKLADREAASAMIKELAGTPGVSRSILSYGDSAGV